MKLELLYGDEDDEWLRQACLPVMTVDHDMIVLADAMLKLMRKRDGIGLAAPQVGRLQRFFVMNETESRHPRHDMVWFNPTWEPAPWSTKIVHEEGCLSFPGKKFKVERHRGVVVTGQAWRRADRGRHQGQLVPCFLGALVPSGADQDPVLAYPGDVGTLSFPFTQHVEAPGPGAFVVQHETDHLDGVLVSDKAVKT